MSLLTDHERTDVSHEFEFSDEMLGLRTMARDFCQTVSSETVVRATMESETGVDRALWRRMGSELGLLGAAVSEAYGGENIGLVYQAIVLEELGASLLCGPVLGTLCLAIPALSALSDERVKADLLPALVAGEQIGTLAAGAQRGRFDPQAVTVQATPLEDGGWSLSGELSFVPDGATSDLLLVAARTPEGTGLFAVASDAGGVNVKALATMDLTRRQADIRLEAVRGRLIADAEEAPAVLERALLIGAALLAAEQVGVAQRMLNLTVTYVSERLQFGQPIGAFQAVKHRCANMLATIEQARSVAYHAAWALEENGDDPRLAVSMARAVASETATWVSTSAIQLHGGMGFTWEGTPQLYFKRATTDALMLGTPEQHVDSVAQIVLDALEPASLRLGA